MRKMKHATRDNIIPVIAVTLFFVVFFGTVALATIFNDTYDTNTPLGTDNPAEADDRMREIKAGGQERCNVDHVWDLTGTEVSGADTGEHRKVLFHEPITSPASIAESHGLFFIKDVAGKAELHWIDEDENEIQLTNAGALYSNVDLEVVGDIIPTSYATTNGGFLDEDDMATDSATATASQQSVKAYVDAVVQVVSTQSGTLSTIINKLIPADNTIPQKSEGQEYTALNTTITPTSATSTLIIEVHVNTAQTINSHIMFPLFKDSDTGALATVSHYPSPSFSRPGPTTLRYIMTSGTTDAITFKLNIGTEANSGVTINGWASAAKFGGVLYSSMTITEIR